MLPRVRPFGPPWSSVSGAVPPLFRDIPIIIAGLALFYGLISLTRYWAAPVNIQPEIHLSPGALPKYALFSVVRIVAAYAISLLVTLVYAYVAAHNARASES